MEDFVLTLVPLPDGHLVRVDCRLIGQPEPRRITLEERQRLEELGTRLAERPLKEITEVVKVGRDLFSRLFGKELANPFWEASEKARDDGGLRVLLRFARDDRLQDLPWELLHDGRWPLALDPATAIARYIEMRQPIAVPRPRERLRVLFTSACPPGAPRLDLGSEERRVRRALELAGLDPQIENRVTLELLKLLLIQAENTGKPFHIWHHAGHGFLDRQGNFRLVLEGGEEGRHVGINEISCILAQCPNLLAVVLNVCHGAALATSLACARVPVAIGFREQILDRAALLFAERFYKSLLRHPVEVALAHSRLALAYQGCPLLNWTNPVLYTRTTRVVRFVEERHGRPRGRA